MDIKKIITFGYINLNMNTTNHFSTLLGIGFLFLSILGYSQESKPLNYYLADIEYDPKIPTPESYLGYQIGDWHVSHDQLLGYFKALDDASPLIELKTYALSHEKRSLVYAVITSEKNKKNINEIKRNHQALANVKTASTVNIDNLPAILYQGYTIHGNEPSGNNAALLVAYYLVAGQSAEVKRTLDNTVILLDPCLNPDGVQRFSTWVNSHRGQNLTADPASRELNEAWPGGRFNHYWFDMNRDWLPLVHPESRGRIQTFHEWHPNVLTDHHEMGTNSTFFFQPGIPSSVNPNTPWENQILTEQIGTYHAKALDSIGSQYYTKANFDDFYYGKGSTYPDAHGCIGILFEQASSRGHLQESINGDVSFPFTIRNQVNTSLSTQRATVGMRKQLLQFKQGFHKMVLDKLSKEKIKSYVFTDTDDVKLGRFMDLLRQHHVDVYTLKQNLSINGINFDANNSYQVPLDQSNPIIAKTIFEEVRNFQDSSFYDVSGWTVAHAYGLTFKPYDQGLQANATPVPAKSTTSQIIKTGKNTPYAYAIPAGQHYLHKVLANLQKSNVLTKTNQVEIQWSNGNDKINLPLGSIIIPTNGQNEIIEPIIRKAIERSPLTVYALDGGNGTSNVTLGHPQVVSLELPKVLVIVNQSITATSAGEIWHHLDTELDIAATYLESQRFRSTSLNRYNTIIMPEGSYNIWGESEYKKLKDWVAQGNVIIAFGSGAEWLADQKIVPTVSRKNQDSGLSSNYVSLDRESDAKIVGGSIFEAKVDNSHPLFYGYNNKKVAFMHSGTKFYEPTTNKYATPAVYTNDFLLSGYLPKTLKTPIPGAAVTTVYSLGSGRIISYLDNPLFRGFWYAGMKTFNNAVFFGKVIDRRSTENAD